MSNGPEITTFQTDSRIVATTSTATLTVALDVARTTDQRELETLAATLTRTLLAAPDVEGSAVTLPTGTVRLHGGIGYGDTPIDAFADQIGRLVAAVMDVYWHIELDGGHPEHFVDADGDQPVRADGGQR